MHPVFCNDDLFDAIIKLSPKSSGANLVNNGHLSKMSSADIIHFFTQNQANDLRQLIRAAIFEIIEKSQ